MNRKSILSLLALLALAGASMAAVQGPAVVFSSGQETTDSLAAAADTLSAQTLPDRFDSLKVTFFSPDTLVLCTLQVNGGTAAAAQWITIDTTTVGPTTAAVGTIPGEYAGRQWRLIADNQGAATHWGRAYVASFR